MFVYLGLQKKKKIYLWIQGYIMIQSIYLCQLAFLLCLNKKADNATQPIKKTYVTKASLSGHGNEKCT